MPLLLTREDVIAVLKMDDCIKVVEQAFLELENGTAVLPLRIGIAPPDGISLYMPAYLQKMNALACKVVTVYKNNPQKGMPVIYGKVLLQDPETGDVTAIMDGGYLTAVRTGAVSGVATKYLARKNKNQIVGIFGTGVQAKMQLLAMTVVRDVSKVLIYDISDEAANNFKNEMTSKIDAEIIKVKSPDEVLESDIICAATSSPTPIFDGSKVKEGTHINGIGSHTPNARELDTQIIKRSKVVGDSEEACFNEAGDIMIPLKNGEIEKRHFYAELGEIVARKKDGRSNDSEITIFKSNGLAIQDAATAKLVYDKAKDVNIGTEVAI